VLVANAAQAAEDVQRSVAIDAADAQTLLQTALQDVQTQTATSMLADLIGVPVSIVKQLNGKQQDHVQCLDAFLQQHKLQELCMSILQQCPNGTRLVQMSAAVDSFVRQTGPEFSVGPDRGTWLAAMQLLGELQELIGYGEIDAYLQLCELLLVAATPQQLCPQLCRVREQLQAICFDVQVQNFYAAQAAATAAAAEAMAASYAPASTALFSTAVQAELNESLAVPQSARYEYSCSNSVFSAGSSSSSSSSSSMPSWHASTAAAPAAASNIAAATSSGVACTSPGWDAASRSSSSLQEQYNSAPAAGDSIIAWLGCRCDGIIGAAYSAGNAAASAPGDGGEAALPEDPFNMGCSADDSGSTSNSDDAAALPEDPFGMGCSADDSNSSSNSAGLSNYSGAGAGDDSGRDTSSSLLPVSGTALVCENSEQLSDDGPGTPAVVSVAASCAASPRPSCDGAGDGSSSSSSGNVQSIAGSKQEQQRVEGKGGVQRGVAGCAVIRPIKLLLTVTALLCKPRFG
jgi:hypothetical protein